MNIDWTEIIMALLGLLGLLISGVLIPYINTKKELAKAQLTEEQRKTLDYWVGVGVTAFETYYKESGAGPRKKEEVKEFIRSFINGRDLDITTEQLDKMIDAAVQNLINKPWEQFTGVAGITRKAE